MLDIKSVFVVSSFVWVWLHHVYSGSFVLLLLLLMADGSHVGSFLVVVPGIPPVGMVPSNHSSREIAAAAVAVVFDHSSIGYHTIMWSWTITVPSM